MEGSSTNTGLHGREQRAFANLCRDLSVMFRVVMGAERAPRSPCSDALASPGSQG